jgi:probable lipoprotein (TIGR04455 family)
MNLRVGLGLLLLTGCSGVKTSVRPDWDQYASKVKRLTVVVEPPPNGQQRAGEAWSRIVRRYVNMKRNFLVRAELVQATPVELAAVCVEGTEGVLWVKPAVTEKDLQEWTPSAEGPIRWVHRGGFEAKVEAKLVRCGDALELWTGTSSGSYTATDDKLVEVTSMYGREYGPQVEAYIPLAMNMLRPLLDTLPQPVLTKEEEDEKVMVDE